MKHLGVVYDVGLSFAPGELSVPVWDTTLARYDIGSIANDLHATSIRLEGEVIERLEEAARMAHEHGLTVFFNPWLMHASPEETRTYLVGAAEVAEQLRLDGVDIVFVAGCELSIFSAGIYPGDGYAERGMWMFTQSQAGEEGKAELAKRAVLLNEALKQLTDTVKATFDGPVTYSAGLWEDVDWSRFDIIGLDFYRHGEPASEYIKKLDSYRSLGKPIVATELGCCKFEGAAALGDGGFAIIVGGNPDGSAQFKDDSQPSRNEEEQADYLAEQFDLLNEAGIDGAFAFEFSKPALPTGDGAFDFDIASFAIVKTFPEDDSRSQHMPPWAPTKGYYRLGEVFARMKQN